MKRIILFFLIFLLPFSSGLKISGEKVKYVLDFEPNLSIENDFFVTNAEGYTSNYEFEVRRISGADLREYFTVTPAKMENVPDGDSRPFKVNLDLPKFIDTPGESEAWVKVNVAPLEGTTGIAAFPSLVIRYIIFVLYPNKYLEWGFGIPNMNVNETTNIEINMNNLGTPEIYSIRGNTTILTADGSIVKKIDSFKASNLKSQETKKLSAEFSSIGLQSGNYKAFTTLVWDDNSSSKEIEFKIGRKDVKIHNFTRKFEIDSINKMYIDVESNWNSEIKNLYADISVFEDGQVIKKFKSLNSDLKAFEAKKIEAYFDTNELEKKEYIVLVELNYENEASSLEGTVTVDENVNTDVVEEIPNKFDVSLAITPLNIMILLLVVFLMINMVLMLKSLKKKKATEEIEINPDVLEKIKELKKEYNEQQIKEMMVKKGWEEKKIDKILEKLR